MQRATHPAIFLLACLLSACASAPVPTSPFENQRFNPKTDPYWDDPAWNARLVVAIQSALQAPVDPGDTSTPGYRATIRFRFQNGVIEYPEIVTGTGKPDLDKLLIDQVASVQPQKPTGSHADEPHDYILDVDMPTPYEAFQRSIYDAIEYQKLYPKDAILTGTTGTATLDFDYVDGSASRIAITVSSNNKLLDKTSLNTVTRSKMPPAPSAYAGKTFHMQVLFCYTLWESPTDIKNKCPVSSNVIEVRGTRIRRVY